MNQLSSKIAKTLASAVVTAAALSGGAFAAGCAGNKCGPKSSMAKCAAKCGPKSSMTKCGACKAKKMKAKCGACKAKCGAKSGGCAAVKQ